jgi:hypothetical protein
MNPDRLALPKSKPASVAASSHRAPSPSMPTEANKPPAVRGRKFSGLDPFTVSLIASAPVVSPAVRVVGRRVPAQPSIAPVALEVAPLAEVVEPKPAGPNRLMLGLGAALAVGLAGFAGLKARSA